jgi:hypothetical protein
MSGNEGGGAVVIALPTAAVAQVGVFQPGSITFKLVPQGVRRGE